MSNDASEELKFLKESKLIYPDLEKAKKTNAASLEKWNEMLRLSWNNPQKFWDDVASQLYWIKPWEKTIEGELPNFRFFVGGITNPCYNLIDKNINMGYGNKAALIFEGEDYVTKFYTYSMLLAEVNRFANTLKRLGLKKGDRVAIFMPNFAENVITILACYRLGILFNTIFSGFSVQALRDRLINYKPHLIVTSDVGFRRGKTLLLKENVDRAIENIDSIKTVIVVKRGNIDVTMNEGKDYWYEELIAKESINCEPEPLEANEPGIVFYTSGTVGKPKGVVHSGSAFVINNYIYSKYLMDHHPNDVFWCTADLGWLTMHIFGIAGALANGVTTIFYDGALDFPKIDRYYQIIEKYRVNKLYTTPTAIRMLKKHGEKIITKYDLSCLEVMALVGEPFSPEDWYWAYEQLGKKKIYINNTWGQTETAGTPIAHAAWLVPMKPGSSGIQFLGTKADVVDNEGNSLPPNIPGTLVLKQAFPMLVRTLWKEHDKYLKEYFSQFKGTYFTNDAAVKDNDGHFWIIGRIDDTINVAGHRLSTMEMESAIAECQEVAETAVFGVPDEIKGLVPVAFVILRTGYVESKKLEEKIKAKVIARISKIALPNKIYFTDVLPKTVSGKIMRRLLKEAVTVGKVKGDITGLEDRSTIEKIIEIVSKKDK